MLCTRNHHTGQTASSEEVPSHINKRVRQDLRGTEGIIEVSMICNEVLKRRKQVLGNKKTDEKLQMENPEF